MLFTQGGVLYVYPTNSKIVFESYCNMIPDDDLNQLKT